MSLGQYSTCPSSAAIANLVEKTLQNIITMKQRNFFNANITRLVARALEQYLKSFPLAASLRLIFIFIYFVSRLSLITRRICIFRLV